MKPKLNFACLLHNTATTVQNSHVPAGVSLIDTESYQWKDGRSYPYVSRDESPDHYRSWRYDPLTTSDLKQRKITKNAFTSKGSNDQAPYSDGELYASDAAGRNGKYYLYHSMHDRNDEGVAVSESSIGSFRNGSLCASFLSITTDSSTSNRSALPQNNLSRS